MKKFFAAVCLIFLIVTSFGFVALKLGLLGSDDNYFNQHLRNRLAAKPWLRNLFSLHYDGDSRADYLGSRYDNILIEVDAMDKTMPNREALDILVQKIQTITAKPTVYLLSQTDLPYDLTIDDNRIHELVSSNRDLKSAGNTAVIYLLYVSTKTEDESILGSTFEDFGIVLYYQTLQEFTQTAPRTAVLYEASTALHEFGHQLGLDHNQQQNCLMNARVESAVSVLQLPGAVVTDFCSLELEILKNQRQSY